MTYDEITLFGRFLQDKSMQKNYGYFYDNHRFDRRPMDKFLEETDAEDAILSAFDIAAAPNTIFSPKYWQTLNDKWMKRLKEFRDGGGKLDAGSVRCEHCGRMMPYSSFALNAKGQLHKYCRECESGEWDRRRKEEEAATKEKERQEKAIRQLEKETAPRLGEHDATLHYKDGSRRIVFNAVLSQKVQAAGLTKCYLSTERDGRQFLVFNNSEGANVTVAGTAGKSPGLSQVHSVSICRQIAERFRLAYGDLYYLHVTKDLSKLKDTINVEVKQVHSREEYAAIAARREEQARKDAPVPGDDVPEYEVPDTPLVDFSEEPEQEHGGGHGCEPVLTRPKDDRAPDGGAGQAGIPLTGKNPAGILQQLVDRGHMTERDIAKFLYDRGWKLQEPVVVTTHKKFKA